MYVCIVLLYCTELVKLIKQMVQHQTQDTVKHLISFFNKFCFGSTVKKIGEKQKKTKRYSNLFWREVQ
uniref:Uncharacterized protein n=1 Tax=Octopus bimaculoides TaxID=37653 RepID=A0A0L8FRC2_OCTBM